MILRLDLSFRNDSVESSMKLRVYSNAAKEAISAYASNLGRDMEMYAKHNHPWTNRTGNAERGLNASVETSGAGWAQRIRLAHGSDIYYGVYLENSMGRRFAIIEPTVRVFSSRLVNDLGSIFNNINV